MPLSTSPPPPTPSSAGAGGAWRGGHGHGRPPAPHSLLWPLLVAAACAWNCCLLPARLAFPCRTPRSAPYWLAADGLCDLIYLCDLLLVQPRLPATRGGDVIVSGCVGDAIVIGQTDVTS